MIFAIITHDNRLMKPRNVNECVSEHEDMNSLFDKINREITNSYSPIVTYIWGIDPRYGDKDSEWFNNTPVDINSAYYVVRV